MRFAAEAVLSIVEWWIGPLPGALGRRARYLYYKCRLKHIGSKVSIDVGVRINNPQYVSIGDNTWIDNYVVILAGPPSTGGGRVIKRKPNPAYRHSEGEVVIGSQCHIANFVVLQGHGGLSIGDNSGVASGSMLYSMSHHYCNLDDRDDGTVYKFSPMVPTSEQSLIVSPVVMERNSALGLSSVMLPGATIHEGSWVGTKSVVTASVPAFSIASGTPARVLSARRGIRD